MFLLFGGILFFYAKLIDGLLCIDFTWFEYAAWEVRTIRCVGEVLCLEAERTVFGIGCTAVARKTAVPVAAVELHTGFGGPHFHLSAAGGLNTFDCIRQFARFSLVEHIAVVIACAVDDLLTFCVANAFAYGMRCTEVEGRTFYLEYLACRYACFINGDKEVCIDSQYVVQCFWRRVCNACEGEEAMACHVDNGLLVGCATIVDDEFVLIGKTIFDVHVQFAWEAFFVVRRNVAKHQFLFVDLLCFPNACMETSWTAMQMVGAVVDSQAIVFAVHREVSLGNAVAIAAYKGAEERLRTIDHVLNGVMSLNNIGHLAFLVGNHDGHDGTSVIGDADFHSVAVRQDEEVCLLSLNDSLEVFSLKSGNKFAHIKFIGFVVSF